MNKFTDHVGALINEVKNDTMRANLIGGPLGYAAVQQANAARTDDEESDAPGLS